MKEKRKTKKSNDKIKMIGKLILIGATVTIIFIAAPHCMQATKNFATWLYELEEEYITRFWTVLLSVISLIPIVFFNKVKEEYEERN